MGKSFLRCISIISCFALAHTYAWAGDPNHRIEVYGETFEYYDVIDKDMSPYALSQMLDWNLDTLHRYNAAALTDLKKGMRLLYPIAANKTPSSEATANEGTDENVFRHTVRKGESIYSISKLYDISPDALYASNPGVSRGVKPGQELSIPLRPGTMYYTVRGNEGIGEIAKKYDTTVRRLLQDNPGVAPGKMRAGTIIRVPIGSASEESPQIKVNFKKVLEFDAYKADKNDTWSSIARLYPDMDPTQLRNVNIGKPLNKNTWISVPLTQEFTRLERRPLEDQELLSEADLDTIYQEVNTPSVIIAPAQEGEYIVEEDVETQDMPPLQKTLMIDIVLEDASTTKDREFMMGFLQRLNELGLTAPLINLSVIDGKGVEKWDTISSFENSDLIISTFEKALPQSLAQFALDYRVALLNVFDVRSEIFLDNPMVANLMSPSAYFNDAVTQYTADRFANANVVIIGDIAPDDQLSNYIVQDLEARTVAMTLDEIKEYDFDTAQEWLLFVMPTDRAGFSNTLNALSEIQTRLPEIQYSTLCRPNHVVYAESLKDKLVKNHALIPTRVFFNPDSPEADLFLSGYRMLYNRDPANTFPNYAAMGYDVAQYFIPVLEYNEGDFNFGFPQQFGSLQTDFVPERQSSWSGFFNTLNYMLEFQPQEIIKHKIR